MNFKGIEVDALTVNPVSIRIKRIIMLEDNPAAEQNVAQGVLLEKAINKQSSYPEANLSETNNPFAINSLHKKWHFKNINTNTPSEGASAVVIRKTTKSLRIEERLAPSSKDWLLNNKIMRFFTSLPQINDAEVAQLILENNKKNKILEEQKKDTLVVEWAGVNELLINGELSIEAADKAINLRAENIKKLIANGYRNFMMISMTNLSLTPRYQNKSTTAQLRARKCSTYFNKQLAQLCKHFNLNHPYCSFETFNVNPLFEYIYFNPQKFLLNKDKLKTPFKSQNTNGSANNLSASKGYMFYNDLYPTANIRALLAAYFYHRLFVKYKLLEVHRSRLKKRDILRKELRRTIRKKYMKKVARNKHRFFTSIKETFFKPPLREVSTRRAAFF